MEAQMKKGLLDAYVLSVIRKEDTYGYRIVASVTSVLEISESTLYPVLRRLESGGFVTTYNVEHNSRLRKYYSITEQGRVRLEYYKTELAKVKTVIDFIINENKTHESESEKEQQENSEVEQHEQS